MAAAARRRAGSRRGDRPRLSRFHILLLGLVIGLAAGLLIGELRKGDRADDAPGDGGAPTVVQGGILEDGALPDEARPEGDCGLEVADGEPQRLRIDELGVDACIQEVGVDAENRIGAPANIHVAGWFTGASDPGSDGLAIIDGHNRGSTTDGVFVDLHELAPGATVSVELGGGRLLRYRVQQVDVVAREQSVAALYRLAQAHSEALGMITCAGDWDTDADSRTDRVVVIATPV